MTQADIQNSMGVVHYLREYAIRSAGNQPLAIGVTADAYTVIAKEMGADLNGGGLIFLKVCDVLIVVAAR